MPTTKLARMLRGLFERDTYNGKNLFVQDSLAKTERKFKGSQNGFKPSPFWNLPFLIGHDLNTSITKRSQNGQQSACYHI